jgi:hypothetical protein
VKPRRVIVELEIETSAPLDAIKEEYGRDCTMWEGTSKRHDVRVQQVQVNVVKPVKRPARKRS